MEASVVILRFSLAFLLAFLFGLQRQRSHKPVGFGTFTFVTMGSCALAITASTIAHDNPLALLGAIVTGIGFLGAGALIKTTDKIFGFTTAASIWVFAIFGLTIGIGEYLIAGLLYGAVWIIIFFDRAFEKRGIGSYQVKMSITTNMIVPEKEIKHHLDAHVRKNKLISMDIDKKQSRMVASYVIEASKDKINKLASALYKQEWFEAVKVEG